MTDSWWAKKLGRSAAPAPEQREYANPTYTQPPTPQGYAVAAAQQQMQEGDPDPWIDDPNVPGGKRLNWRRWSGGEAAAKETGRCPKCGSTNFFSRSSGAKVTANGMANPAPQCFNCSYNGIFEIFGAEVTGEAPA